VAYTEIVTSGNSAVVAQEQWNDECHREYVGQLKFKFLMGTGEDAVIVVREDLTKKAGDAVTVRYASAQTGGVVRGNAKGEGNEGSMSFYAQRFLVDNVRSLHKIEDVPMTEKRVSFSVKNEMKYALTQKHAETLEDDMLAMLCDATSPRVRGRYLYGAADSNWNATHATALTNVDGTNDMLTGAIISAAKRKAVIKGTGVLNKIRPTKIKNGLAMEEWFMFLGHTYAIRDLVNNDAIFRNNQLMLPPGSRDNSIYFSGSHFKGSHDGVLIYEYDRIPLVASTIQVCHNVLLGAKAGAVCWGQRTKFTDDDSLDYGHDYGAELHDIRNKLVIGSSNNLKSVYNATHDYGLVNVFTAAVAD
jgi:hypothetical protein